MRLTRQTQMIKICFLISVRQRQVQLQRIFAKLTSSKDLFYFYTKYT